MIVRDEKLVVRFGESLPDVEAYLQTALRLWLSEHSRTNRAKPDWDLGVGYAGALELAKTGWAEGARRMEFELAQVTQIGERKHTTFDVAGETPDVGRFCAGEPLHMRVNKRQNKPVVTLLVNVCCSASVSARQFAAYGGAVAALVDQLENSGHRVELHAVGVNGHVGKGRSICGWTVKRASDALDLSAIAFSIAHPAAFRRIMFALWERTPARLYSSGYGSVEQLRASDAEALDCPDAILLDGVGLAGNGVTAAEMNKRLAANVEKALGIKILEA